MPVVEGTVVVAGVVAFPFIWRHAPRLLPAKYRAVSALRHQVQYALAFLTAAVVAAAAIKLAGVADARLWDYAGDALSPTLVPREQGGDHDDSWRPMFRAIEYLHSPHTDSVYQALFVSAQRFQYPLSSLLPIELLWRMGIRSYASIFLIGNLVGWLSFLLIGLLLPWIWNASARKFSAVDVPLLRGPYIAVASALGLVAAFFFYPITRGLSLGQTQTVLVLLIALGLLAFLHGRPGWAGVLFALCCLVKPQWAFIFIWAAARRQWRFSLAGVATALVGVGASVVVYGPKDFFAYLDVTRALGSQGESYYANQSVNGLVNRILFNGMNVQWDTSNIAPPNTAVALATIGTTVLMLGTVLVWRVRQTPTVVDLSLVILTMTIASPVAWEHHYGVVLPILAVILPVLERTREAGVATVLTVGVAAFLVSQDLFEIVNPLASTRWNFLQAYMFFAGLTLLVMLYRLSRVAGEPARPTPSGVPSLASIPSPAS